MSRQTSVLILQEKVGILKGSLQNSSSKRLSLFISLNFLCLKRLNNFVIMDKMDVSFSPSVLKIVVLL